MLYVRNRTKDSGPIEIKLLLTSVESRFLAGEVDEVNVFR